jgi:hypothetical protein
MPRLGEYKKDAGYNAIHAWVRYHKPKPSRCEHCGQERHVEAANISGEYRRDLDDYKWLCSPCHLLFDNHKIKALETIKKKWQRRKLCKNGHQLQIVGYYEWRTREGGTTRVCRQCKLNLYYRRTNGNETS